MFYGIYTDSFVRANNSMPIKREAVLSPTLQKTQSVFSRIYDSILTIFYSIKTAFYSKSGSGSIYGEKCIVKTQNTGKSIDISRYIELARTPHSIDSKTQSRLEARGYDPKKITSLSPLPVDGGKCNGAVNHFIDKVLETPNEIETIAKEFEGGVPFEGALDHELYSQLEPVVSQHLNALFCQLDLPKILNTNERIWLEYPPAQAREARIITGYVMYLRLKQPDIDPIEWVDNYIQTSKPNEEQLEGNTIEKLCERLSQSEKASLYQIVSLCQYGTGGVERLVLEFKGLEMEQQSPSLEVRKPDDIVNQVENLEKGAYKISFPITNYWGRADRFHTIACIVQENGSTIFYDPNYTIAEVESGSRAKTIKRVFKRYNRFPTDAKLPGFQLHRIKRSH